MSIEVLTIGFIMGCIFWWGIYLTHNIHVPNELVPLGKAMIVIGFIGMSICSLIA